MAGTKRTTNRRTIMSDSTALDAALAAYDAVLDAALATRAAALDAALDAYDAALATRAAALAAAIDAAIDAYDAAHDAARETYTAARLKETRTGAGE
jgi:hypothetical protein